MKLKNDPDKPQDSYLLGSMNWFWEDLKDTPKNPWNIALLAEEEDIELFQAINLTLNYLKEDTYAYYSTEELPLKAVENLANGYLSHHAKIPYIGKSIYTEQPMTCLTTEFGEDNSQIAKLAYWENGGIYGYRDEHLREKAFVLIVNDKTAKIFGYPTIEVVKESFLAKDSQKESD